MPLHAEAARSWMSRWDRQQEHYLPDREQRFAVIAEIVAHTADRLRRPDPLVLDVGCGPGSLSARIRRRLPQARFVGVDSDPLLLGLATASYPWLELVDRDLRAPQWTAALPAGTFDAIVSTTALHWLRHDELAALYADLAGLLRPGGVFVNGDHLPAARDHTVLNDLGERLRQRQVLWTGVAGREDWAAWWAAANDAPELADLVAVRGERSVKHNKDGEVGFDDQAELLRAQGFAEVGSLWQFGSDRILVGVR
jgi:SAM-dependent methyltransferase